MSASPAGRPAGGAASAEALCACGNLFAGVSPSGPPAPSARLEACGLCGTRVLLPVPSEESLHAFYGDDYYGTGPSKFVGPVERCRDLLHASRARRVHRLGGGRRLRVLDIGCGSGRFLAAMADRGHACEGTELTAHSGRRAASIPGVRVHVGPLAEASFPEGAFDMITLWHVLEHLRDPAASLRRCRRWLARDGWLVAAVPNTASWQARLFRAHWFHLDTPRHLFHFTPASLATALQQAGFTAPRVRHLSWEHNPYGVLQSALNALGFRRDALFDTLKGSGGPGLGPLAAAAAAVLAPPAVAFALGEALFGRGGTIEAVARTAPA
ncbi:MAG TPA: class I SAM-dependent methyltransferase [Vicinamibacteria bacterium]